MRVKYFLAAMLALVVAIGTVGCATRTQLSEASLTVQSLTNGAAEQIWSPNLDGITTLESASEQPPKFHATWPSLANEDEINTPVSQVVNAWIDAFSLGHGKDDSATQTITWQLTSASARFITVTLWEQVAQPDSTALQVRSLVLDKDAKKVVEPAELFSEAGKKALGKAFLDKATSAKLIQGNAPARLDAQDVDSMVRGVGISRDGDLVVYIGTDKIAGVTAQVFAVTVSKDQAEQLFSGAGLTWFQDPQIGTPAGAAAANGTDHLATASPSPSESDSSMAVDCAVTKCIAITFDDGPGPYTEKLLDELKAAKVKATFFTVGNQVARHPEIVKREVQEGHAVGNHSWNHPQLTKVSKGEVARQLNKTSDAIFNASGKRPELFRPPYGAWSKKIDSHGMAVIMWDVDTEDWKNRNAAITTKRALEGAHPGAIILFHDIHPSTVEAIPGIIAKLQQQGYTLVTVPQLLGETMKAGHVFYDGKHPKKA